MIFPLPQLETSNIKISFFITSSLSPSLEFLRKYKIEVEKDKVSINVRNEEYKPNIKRWLKNLNVSDESMRSRTSLKYKK